MSILTTVEAVDSVLTGVYVKVLRLAHRVASLHKVRNTLVPVSRLVFLPKSYCESFAVVRLTCMKTMHFTTIRRGTGYRSLKCAQAGDAWLSEIHLCGLMLILTFCASERS